MDWKKNLFQNFKLYAVTDVRRDDRTILRRIEAVYRGGAEIVQLRSKELSFGELYRLGIAIRGLATRLRKLYFVNDHLDLALATAADGLHVGQNDLPVAAIRSVLRRQGRSLIVGKSTHRIEEARRAIREGVDYIGVGPVYATPTKPGRPGVGLRYVRQAAREVRIPFVAIGGIDLGNAARVLEAGAGRLAVVRALFNAKAPEKAARDFVNLIQAKARKEGI
ncbi:MAG: thiamine phosphate synthase [Candidatus Omnitrophota bacterium]